MGKKLLKPKLFLWLLISLLLTQCDVYKAFKENRKIVKFLNKEFKIWLAEEQIINSSYNSIVEDENFDSEFLYTQLEKILMPATQRLSDIIRKTKVEHSKLLNIKKLFLKKIDDMYDGFDKIKYGLSLKDNEESMDYINQGRKQLLDVNKINTEIESYVKDLVEEYYIKTKTEKKAPKKIEIKAKTKIPATDLPDRDFSFLNKTQNKEENRPIDSEK